MSNHKSSSEKKSVEQNLSKDYTSKSGAGKLPTSNHANNESKKSTEKIQKEMEKFKTGFLKNIKKLIL